jgi:hypothetical protein
MNRLKLDWALSTSTERTEFVHSYISQEPFLSKPPSSEELETLANYVLWGKNENGESLEKEGLIELPRKNSTWSSQPVESLDELTESPTFNEGLIYALTSKAPTKKVREVFSREETLKSCPSHLLPTYKSLWNEIDKTELTINLYELLHGKREKEPRAELLNSRIEEEQAQCAERSKSINQFKYLKLRHLLVELRREQYTLRDSFSERILPHSPGSFQEETTTIIDADIPVFPLGLSNKQLISTLLFKPFSDLIPDNFTEKDLTIISNFYWSKQSTKNETARCIDFTDLKTVYELFLLLEDLEEEPTEGVLSTTEELLNTLKFYMREADLTEVQREILDLKIKRKKNQDIASYINKKYGKSYTTNYISTIFRQKIIPTINGAAAYHEQIVGNLFFKEEFKQCSKCGKTLLRDPINFVKKSRAKDGLSNRCKECDKKDRESKNKEIMRNV